MLWFILLTVFLVLVLPIFVLLGLWTLERIEIQEIDWRDED
jgi:cytochrome oxidase assembly protein ShyY1